MMQTKAYDCTNTVMEAEIICTAQRLAQAITNIHNTEYSNRPARDWLGAADWSWFHCTSIDVPCLLAHECTYVGCAPYGHYSTLRVHNRNGLRE